MSPDVRAFFATKKKRMNRLFTFLLLLAVAGSSLAQENPSLGIRGGLANGLAVKWFLVEDTEAIEGIVTLRQTAASSTLAITGLYELHNYDFASADLRWYYGAGAHIALGSNASGASQTGLGIDAIIGIEYRIKGGPISVGADWKPGLAVIGSGGLVGDEGAITLRYQL